jgi:hypothetical protein
VGLAGQEVPNIREWLVQRGYLLGDDSDLERISENTPFEEMVQIYDRLDKKYRPKAFTPLERNRVDE